MVEEKTIATVLLLGSIGFVLTTLWRYRRLKTFVGAPAHVLLVYGGKNRRFIYRLMWALVCALIVAIVWKSGSDGDIWHSASIFAPSVVLGAVTLSNTIRLRSVAGRNGILIGMKFVPWNEKTAILWDKDTGQNVWGCSLTYDNPRSQRGVTARLWVRRQDKFELDELLAERRAAPPPTIPH